ncbi:hypothetical protein [Haloplanus aerogenes]|uniref:DNA primase/polymerase bifunctional N-terminal domain-containing protein n=1 Tax=Haloplanus aerogenes TaxID=660522 RepID=A0A3M0CMM3_9EURY|nr:hypothetical protein [Haloplanus aerogenes]AZH26012.1 hypothetical protein DU502_11855 [Haloplanus aerogenes]RMB08259.1 hypothetical protein ATH50_3676 [Haloplanus aerogenes]
MRSLEPSGAKPNGLLHNLKKLDRWVCWASVDEDGHVRKKPAEIEAGSVRTVTYKDISNWYSYDEAVETASSHDELEGVGVVISRERDDFVVVDIDNCIDPTTGRIDEEVWKYVRRAQTYAELSYSKTGLHLIFRGSLPNQGWTAEDDEIDAEIYDKYFIVVTQDHIAGTSRHAINNGTWLDRIYEDMDIEWTTLFYGTD